MSGLSRFPDVSEYLRLIDQFISGDLSAPEFEKLYLKKVKNEKRVLGDPVFPILQKLFGDADAYVEDPALRTEEDDLDDDALFASAVFAKEKLSQLGLNL